LKNKADESLGEYSFEMCSPFFCCWKIFLHLLPLTLQVREETEAVHQALRNIAEAVINDADQTRIDEESAEESITLQRSISPYRPRSISPTGK
jgi:hypothetical protein